MGKLDGRVALVTGGAVGMGAAHCRALAAEGATVAVCDVDAAAGAALAAEIGGRFYALEVAAESEWAAVAEAVASQLGPVTVLVNNAGVCRMNTVQETTTDEWRLTMGVNLDGPFYGIRAIAPQMKAAGGGVIINVSSAGGMTGAPAMASYTASKWAVRGLTKAAALDLAPDGIRVLSLHPALVRTPMSSHLDLAAVTAGYLAGDDAEKMEILKEILRIEPQASMIYRSVTEPIPGVEPDTVAAGERLSLDIRAANLDEDVVGADPTRIDPDRARRMKNNGAWMSFGDGAHFCPGWQVALTETRVLLDRLFRVPGLRLARHPEMEWTPPMLQSYQFANAVITCDRA